MLVQFAQLAMEGILKYLSNLMKKNRDGFPRQRLVRIPADIIRRCRKSKLLNDLHVTDLGHFPASAGHWVDRPKGCQTNILIYCVAGIGWVSLSGKRKTPIRPGGMVCIPTGIPHRYGASDHNPWQIYWVHFNGLRSRDYLDRLGCGSGMVGEISPLESGMITDAFEETHEALHQGFTDAALLILSANLARLLALTIGVLQAPGHKSRQTGQRILHSMQWLRKHLAEPLTLPQIAKQAGLSVPHYCSLFKKQTGQSPMRYLAHARMSLACELLDSTDMMVSEISSATGFNDAFHFSRTFRAIVGASPRAYRDECAKVLPGRRAKS